MIYLDRRVGSKELLRYLRGAELCDLEFGDAAFVGQGPETPVYVGVERKTVRDFVNSTISGRFSTHQLPGLFAAYHYVYIVVEGLWRANPEDDSLEMRKGPRWATPKGMDNVLGSDLIAMVNSLQVCAGAIVVTTSGLRETAQFLRAIHRWWNRDWRSHRSHKDVRRERFPTAMLSKPSLRRRVAAELPGIGFERSGAAEARFATVHGMVNATPAAWASVKGVGKTTAERVHEAIRRPE